MRRELLRGTILAAIVCAVIFVVTFAAGWKFEVGTAVEMVALAYGLAVLRAKHVFPR